MRLAESALTTLSLSLLSAEPKTYRLEADYPNSLLAHESLKCPNRWESLLVSTRVLSFVYSAEVVLCSRYFVSEFSRNFGEYICFRCLLVATDGVAELLTCRFQAFWNVLA
jgi:hypothetical protein